jgi:hypothetical protein
MSDEICYVNCDVGYFICFPWLLIGLLCRDHSESSHNYWFFCGNLDLGIIGGCDVHVHVYFNNYHFIWHVWVSYLGNFFL